ncbi:DUF2852 domain-containing protein [Stappia stellulata]|uniref:DUF2852 domain-containing protein n=1 Tax=Stappia TaxID=152161 RepID=UPI001CD48EEA|nr:DUF2852 domain-containing protein [Stappia stellulata]MCA1244729.1 DUF2852 domain-containing protein [Stappia stellulata]|eukprot:jgi/Tetstr1/445315/TSEL_033113.t1
MTCSSTLKPGWSPMTIGLMVLGFIVFWPLGLAMLAYILWGDRFHGMARDARHQWDQSPMKRSFQTGDFQPHGYGRTGNVAFDDYRARELKRLEEERARLDTMRAEFDDFLRELRRAKDQDEFDRFMAKKGHGPASTTAT